MSALYENIMALCQEHGIKGGKMCSDIGISKSTLTELKMGRKRGMTAKTAKKIADYFGVPVDRVLNPQPQNEPEPIQQQMSAKELEAWRTIQDTASRVLGSAPNEQSPTPAGVELNSDQRAAMDIVMQMSEDQLRRFIKMAEIMLEEPSGK